MEERVTPKEYIFELATYFVTSARGCIDEPLLYGPFRLLDGLSRLALISDFVPCVEKDEFLLAMKKKVDADKYIVTRSEEEFTKFLDSLVKEFTAELKRRNGVD
ncbi:MAG TPA: DUF6092 family protein [Terriglobales bacterium]|nr:DUF6092 family protein [Terriglobales bacterium]